MHSAMLSLPAAPALAAGRVQLSRRSAPVRAHQARVQTRRTSTVVLAQHSAERGSAEERVRGACKADERTARASRLKPAATTPSASSSPAAAPPAELAGGGGGSGKGTAGSGGSGGGSNGGSGGGDELSRTLAAAGRSLDSFPADFASALSSGVVAPAAVLTWLACESNPLRKALLFGGGVGFRERLLGDALFLNKLAIEVGIGICTKISAEATKRRENFWKETDFVLANVIMAIIADVALTWLPAPTLPLHPKVAAAASAAARFWAGVPSNAFQMATVACPFSAVQRLAAVGRNGAKLFVVGTAASFVGTGMTNGILAVRKALDPSLKQQGEDMDLVRQSFAYGLYMSVSSNLRYQLLAGVAEQRIIEPLLHGNPLASTAASFVVRTANTFVGSLLWVDFIRLLGLQKQKAAAPQPGAKGKAGKQVPAKAAAGKAAPAKAAPAKLAEKKKAAPAAGKPLPKNAPKAELKKDGKKAVSAKK